MKLTKEYIRNLIKEQLDNTTDIKDGDKFQILNPAPFTSINRLISSLERPVDDPDFMKDEFVNPVKISIVKKNPSDERKYIFQVHFITKDPGAIDRTKKRIQWLIDNKHIQKSVNQ